MFRVCPRGCGLRGTSPGAYSHTSLAGAGTVPGNARAQVHVRHALLDPGLCLVLPRPDRCVCVCRP
jgi:hypothetical protein